MAGNLRPARAAFKEGGPARDSRPMARISRVAGTLLVSLGPVLLPEQDPHQELRPRQLADSNYRRPS